MNTSIAYHVATHAGAPDLAEHARAILDGA